jgi:hypothetical protein
MIDLPLEKLADAVAALRNEVWGNPDQERRALPRIRIWAPRVIYLIDPAVPDPAVPDPAVPDSAAPDADDQAASEVLEVWLVDLACGGIGFLSPRALNVGRAFKMTLPVMDAPSIEILCKVLHCQPAPNGSFTVGARFVKELTAPAPADATVQACDVSAAPQMLKQAS